MIKVYEASERLFTNNGIKILDPLKANVHKEDNGDYYLQVEDKIDNLSYYQEGYILRVKTPWGWQGFRCTNPKKRNKKIECKAWHLYYDSSRYVIADTNVVSKACNAALMQLNGGCDAVTPFTMTSDVATVDSFRCVRKSLEEAISTVIERWGGHLYRDNWNIGVKSSIGQDRGITLAYGKNITNIEAQEDWNNVVTKLMPVGYDGTLLDTPWLTAAGVSYDIPYTKVVEFQQNINKDNYSTEAEYIAALKVDLETQAIAYLNENKVPKVNYTLSAHMDSIADVGDTIYVKHPKCSIDITTNVIAVEWDAISERYTSIEFGNFRKRLKDLLTQTSQQAQTIVKQQTDSVTETLNNKLATATAAIMTVLNDSYVINEGNQILVVDTLPKEDATNVIRINSAGIGFSNTGIIGTFTSAWTIDGHIAAQFITTANLIAGTIGGFTITNDSLSCDITEDFSWLTEVDLNKVKAYILETGTLTDEELEKYDINGDYHIGATDLLGIKMILMGTNPNFSTSKMSINLGSSRDCIVVEGLTGYKAGWKTRIGAGGVSAKTINGDSIICGGASIDDVVIEQGIDGIWTYRKWASGVAECWGMKAYSNVAYSGTYGYMYYASVDKIAYPFTFVDYPNVFLSVQSEYGRASSVVMSSSDNQKYETGTIAVYSPGSTAASTWVSIKAVGRWK